MLFRINGELLAFCLNRMHISKWVTISKASLRKTIAKASALNSKSLGNIFISDLYLTSCVLLLYIIFRLILGSQYRKLLYSQRITAY